MGQYFFIVNPAKKQYLSASTFGENNKASGFMIGLHAIALAVLVCNDNEIPKHHRYGSLAGSWCGDAVYAAGDDNGLPNPYGIQTATEKNPNRNLYLMAYEEFENISYKAIAMLCGGQEYYAKELANRAAELHGGKLLLHLGNIIFQIGCEPLEQALINTFGKDWTKRYKEECDRRYE